MKSYILIILLFAFNSNVRSQISSTSFATNVDFSTGATTANPARLASADLNADGKIDMIVPNNGNSTLSVFRNVNASTGFYTSSFVTQSTITSNTNLQGVVLADLDGDGKPDMITTHGNLGGGGGGGATQIFVYQNGSSTGGSIGFFTGTGFTAGTNPASATAADIDGDGKLDLVIANYGNGFTNTGSIIVLRNTSSGVGSFSFVASTAYATNINTPYTVKVADFDGDGKLDVVAACNLTAGYISVYRNTSTSGSITLTAVNTYTAGTNPEYVEVGDVDGDGKSDIVVTNYGSANFSTFRNTSTGSGSISFATAVNFTTGTNPSGFTLTDFDGDGKLEGAVVNRTSGTLTVYRNTATSGTISSATFATGVSFATNNSPTCIATTDLDGDGKREIIISNQGAGNISVFRNQILALEPTTASSGLTFSGITSSSVTLNFTKGNGAKRIVLAHANSTVNSNPIDSFTYSANASFASGTQIGTGNYVVYNDTGNTLTVSGLSTGTTYYFTVYEYNGTAAYTNYLTSTTLSGSQVISSAVYYSKSTGALNLLSSWGPNADGTGTSPTSFSINNAIYFVVNNSSPTLSANWTITGTNHLIVFGDGVNAFNLAIPAGYILTADTISVRSSVTLTIQGTLSVSRSYFEDGSTAQYLGAAGQSIAPANYFVLVAASGSKVLSGNVIVRNIFNMSTNINEGTYSITLGTGTTQTGTLSRTAGTIIGSFSRWFSNTTNTGATGLFPIGTSTYYRPIQIEYSTAPSAGGKLTATFINSNPGSTGLPLYDFTISASEFLDKQAPDGYWNISVSGLSGGTYSSTVTATSFGYVTNYADLRMLKRNNSTSAWTLPGVAVIGSGSNASPVVKRTGLTTNGGDFGVASDQTLNSLPVKLIILTVHQSNEDAILNWQTASEINSDYFEVERSTDNTDWLAVGRIKAAGNSSEIKNYGYPDNISAMLQQNVKSIYYRLKQVDKDGAIINSTVISLNLKTKISTITLYPLPINNILTAVSNNAENISEVTLFDMNGKQVVSGTTGQLNVSALAQGIYVVKVVTDKQVYFQKITK
jgi:FG-GAP-like repeat/Secretion system C-terminal sorting domain/FG-GAP repeat